MKNSAEVTRPLMRKHGPLGNAAIADEEDAAVVVFNLGFDFLGMLGFFLRLGARGRNTETIRRGPGNKFVKGLRPWRCPNDRHFTPAGPARIRKVMPSVV